MASALLCKFVNASKSNTCPLHTHFVADVYKSDYYLIIKFHIFMDGDGAQN